MAERKSFMLYLDNYKQWEMLDDAQAGALIKAIYRYASTGEQLDSADGMVMMAFSFITSQIDRDAEKYDETCKKRAESARKRYQKPDGEPSANADCELQNLQMHTNASDKDTDTDTDTDTEREKETDIQDASPARSFAPPSVDEVRDYCRKRKNGISAKRFVEHYTAFGWIVNGQPVTDWRALVRKWETMPHSRDKPAQAGGSSIDTADLDALMRRGAS